jgi:hypothetical protein
VTHDLLDPLEAGFADEPPHRPVAERLGSGRRAVRGRRRLAVTTAAVVLGLAAVSLAVLRPAGGAGGGGIDPPTPGPVRPDTPLTQVHLLVAPPRYVGADTPPVLYLYGRMFKRDRDVTVLATFGEIDVSAHRPRGAAIVRVDGHTEWVAVVGNGPEPWSAQRAQAYDYQLFMAWAERRFADARMAGGVT